jgi:Ca2+-binding RTX toxin-like protein
MGTGNDIVQLKSGLASVFGDAGSDRFEIYAAAATVDAGDDNDLINIRGGSGITASGGLGDDRFNIYAGSANLSLDGGDGNDDFFGYFHAVTGSIHGGIGSDYFVQFVSGVSIYGGAGNDIYRADATNPATFIENVGEGTDAVQVARGASYVLPANIENISVQGFHGSVLTAAALTGNALNNTINGHANIETIFGLGGDDRLFAKGGDDTVWGGDGNDYLDGGPGNDTLNGEAGNDTINGRTGNDTMAGGASDDVYYVDSLSDVITENFGEGTDLVRVSVSGYTLAANVENGIVSSGVGGLTLNGNALNNSLIGNTGNDWLLGWEGNDTLTGGAGNDILAGHSGNDILNGGTGNDQMVGGAGDDAYYVDSVSDTVDEDAIDGGAGIDTVITSLSNYSLGGLTVGPIENLTFNGSGGATLEGDPQANIIHGGAGDDIIVSHNGADTLYGGGGTTRFTAETGTLGMAVLDWSCTAEREMTSSRGSRVPARPPIQA